MKKLLIALGVVLGLAGGIAAALPVYGELKAALLEKLGSDPTSTEARIYYNTGSHAPKYYNGSAWRTVANTTDSLSNPMDSTGDMIYGGASGTPTKLDNGTSGQILVAAGASAPTWTSTVSAETTFSSGLKPSSSSDTISSYKALTALSSVDLRGTSNGTVLNGVSGSGSYIRVGKIVTVWTTATSTGAGSATGNIAVLFIGAPDFDSSVSAECIMRETTSSNPFTCTMAQSFGGNNDPYCSTPISVSAKTLKATCTYPTSE